MGWRLRIKHVTGFTYAGTAHASYNEARMTPLTVRPEPNHGWSAVIFNVAR